MITIKNTQRTIPVNEKKIKQLIQKILNIITYNDFDIGIRFTTNQTIKKYNQKYRNKNKPTDILSFPFHENIVVGKKLKVTTDDDKNLGDIIISLEYAKQAAKSLAVPLDTHIKTLLVHGICHLIGYDHIQDKDYKKMHAKETAILKQLQDN